MKELDFAIRTDLGGTKYDFIREVSRDKLTFCLVDKNQLIKLTTPGNKSFLRISKETLNDGVFSEAYYTYAGELTSANIWLRRSYSPTASVKTGLHDKNFLQAYNQLSQIGADIMFEADMGLNEWSLYCCTEDSTADDLDIVTISGGEIPNGALMITFHPDENQEMTPVKFCIRMEDNVLTLGFCVSNEFLIYDIFSTFVNFRKFSGTSSPGEIKEILDSALLRY